MVTLNKPFQSANHFDSFCDKGIFYSLCAVIFILPASIALLDSFAALTVFFYLLKRINRLMINWSLAPSNFIERVIFIWKGFAPYPNFLNRPLQFLTLAVLISVIFSQYPGHSLVAFIGKFVKCLFLYFCCIEVLRDQKRIQIFIGVFLLSTFITVLNGIAQNYLGTDLIKGKVVGFENAVSTHRISASFYGANGLGAYLLLGISLVVHFTYSIYFRRKSWGIFLLAVIFLGLLLLCLCWTYSRSSWVGYLVVLVAATCLDSRKIIYTGLLALVLFVFFIPALNQVRHMELINDRIGNNSENYSILEEGGSGRYIFWQKSPFHHPLIAHLGDRP